MYFVDILLIHGQYTHPFKEYWKLFGRFYINTEQSKENRDKTRNTSHYYTQHSSLLPDKSVRITRIIMRMCIVQVRIISREARNNTERDTTTLTTRVSHLLTNSFPSLLLLPHTWHSLFGSRHVEVGEINAGKCLSFSRTGASPDPDSLPPVFC